MRMFEPLGTRRCVGASASSRRAAGPSRPSSADVKSTSAACASERIPWSDGPSQRSSVAASASSETSGSASSGIAAATTRMRAWRFSSVVSHGGFGPAVSSMRAKVGASDTAN